MLRNTLLLAAMFVVTALSASAEAGIFFNRGGGCPGGRCGASMAAPMAVRSTPPAPAGVAQADAVDQQLTDVDQPAASEQADSAAPLSVSTPVQRASYRVGMFRRFGRMWR